MFLASCSTSGRAASVLRRSRKRYLGSRRGRGESVFFMSRVSYVKNDVFILSTFSDVRNWFVMMILFTLNLMGLLGKQSQTVQERVEPLSRPSAKATEEGHAGLGGVGAARAATDFARNDQRADTALGQIVVRRHLWSRHKDELFG